jgi:acyl-lipid omega-6 desaturase (Delta-12 desaturase)
VPFYHLPEAQKALETAYPAEIIREDWTVRTFLRMFRTCRLYDYESHRWVDYDGTPLTEPLFAPRTDH